MPQKTKKWWAVYGIGVEGKPRHKAQEIEFYESKKEAEERKNVKTRTCKEGFKIISGVNLEPGEILCIRLEIV